MADLKFSELVALVGTPDDDSLIALSEDDGMGNFSSVKMTLGQLKALIGATSSGKYTPTITGVTNVASSTAYECQWSRVGNMVTVSGRVDIDPTSTGNTQFRMTLPVASNFTTNNQAGGTCVVFTGTASNDTFFAIMSEPTNDALLFAGGCDLTLPDYYYFICQYEVI